MNILSYIIAIHFALIFLLPYILRINLKMVEKASLFQPETLRKALILVPLTRAENSSACLKLRALQSQYFVGA